MEILQKVNINVTPLPFSPVQFQYNCYSTKETKVALFGLIKKAFYTRGIWEALGYMLWHGYTTRFTDSIKKKVQITIKMAEKRIKEHAERQMNGVEKIINSIKHKNNKEGVKIKKILRKETENITICDGRTKERKKKKQRKRSQSWVR